MESIIEIQDLTCHYGGAEAVSGLTLRVPEGAVYAFLGTNGAGKTTTIKALLNLMKPTRGFATVLGVPSARLGPAELAQIGYLSPDQQLPLELTLRSLIDYSRALYPTWDDALCQRLCEILAVPFQIPLKEFSRGMKIKAALLLALAYRPRLLFLDEPFGGLDQLVRDELIQSLLELFEQQKWTMFISSHDIAEVERLATWVGIIDAGKLCLSEPIETLLARFRRVDLTLPEGSAPPARWPENILLPELAGTAARWVDARFVDEATTGEQIRHLFPSGIGFALTALSLHDIFLAITRSHHLDPITPR